jgi:hypothetical protein
MLSPQRGLRRKLGADALFSIFFNVSEAMKAPPFKS